MLQHAESLSTDLRNPTLISFLDLSRWLAAAVVFMGHLRNPLFLGYPSVDAGSRTLIVKLWYFVTGLHAEAVIVFFVLSGLLVAGVGAARVSASTFDVKSYSIDRFSRLYIAFLPALLICYVTDSIGATAFSEIGYWDGSHPMIAEKVAAAPFQDLLSPWTLLMNAGMLQAYWASPVGSNQPLWTISTEFWFYVVFGLAAIGVMKKGARRSVTIISLISVFIFLGFAFPIFLGYWLIGLAVAFAPRIGCFGPAVSILTFLSLLFVARFWQADFDQSALLRTLKDYSVAFGFAMVLVSMRGRRNGLLERASKVNKFFADFSYSLYLLHFPLMLFILASLHAVLGLTGIATGYSPTSGEGRVVYFGVITIVCVVAWAFSRVTEARTPFVRRYLKKVIIGEQTVAR